MITPYIVMVVLKVLLLWLAISVNVYIIMFILGEIV